ncbi:MAG: mechanosensitive ion channel family protein [Xanthomonadales bacterium]|nr:mechanosensitive ion channel family protein [Xanthomonadales bacterium]
MNTLFENMAGWIGVDTWIVQAFLVILAALLVEFAYRRFIWRIKKLAKKTTHLWDDAIVYAGMRPVSLLIWCEGLIFAARIAAPHSEVFVFDASILNIVQQLVLVLAATWFFFRLITGAEHAFVAERRKRDEDVDITTVQAIGRIVRIAVVLTGTLTALAVLDIPISGFLAAGGVGGIAIGLAARDLLANFFGGFMVFMDRPFSVGDWVRSPDRDIEGVVEKIGWRMTTIRKFDKRPMYVPNATFTSITVENPSRMTHRRIFEHIGVRYDDFEQVRPIVESIREYVSTHEDLDNKQTTMVHFDTYGAHSLDIMLYCFTKTVVWTEYHAVREDLLLGIGEIVARHGAEIAFPTRTLKVEMAEPLPDRQAGD